MKLTLKFISTMFMVLLLIGILAVFFIVYKVTYTNTIENARDSLRSLNTLAVDNIDRSFELISNSTISLGDEYRKKYLEMQVSPTDTSYYLKSQKSLDKVTGFIFSEEEPESKDPHISLLLYNDKNFTPTVMKEIKTLLSLENTFRTLHDTFNYSWVYITTVNDLIALYPYISFRESEGLYKPTQHHFYKAANFTDKTLGWEEPYFDLTGDGMMVTASYPIYDGDALLGVASRDITIDQLSRAILENSAIYNGSFTYIIDKNGKSVSNSNKKYLSEIDEENSKFYKAILHYRSEGGLKELNNPNYKNSKYSILNNVSENVIQHFRKKHDHKSFIYSHTEDGEKYEVSAAITQIANWHIITITPFNSIYGKSVEAFTLVGWFGGFGILIMYLVISFSLMKYIIQPIENLSTAAVSIGKGDLDVVIPVISNNEIGELSATFNQMAHNLKISQQEIEEYNHTLEQKVIDRTKELNQKNIEIEAKNKHITSSIEYAQKIQAAILPDISKLSAGFQEHFIIYLPKDIVAGDFYWSTYKSPFSFIVAADCTGHGVPGAFLSMIGSTLLSKIVNENNIYDTNEILEKLDFGIKTSLKQNESTEDRTEDGMDLAIIRFEKGKNEIQISGARRPIYHISNGAVNEIPGNKRSIGGRQRGKQEKFVSATVQFQTNDMIYLTSDGFADQSNSEGKKIGSKKLKEFLLEISGMEADVQKARLLQLLIEHKKEEVQRDDIMLIGIRL